VAVVSVNRRHQEESGYRQDNERRAFRSYIVHVDDITDGPDAVEVANDGTTAIPAIGDAYSAGLPYLFCVRIHPTRIDGDPYWWQVSVEYSTRAYQSDRQTVGPPDWSNPLSEVDILRKSYWKETIETHLFFQKFGFPPAVTWIRNKALTNTLGHLMAPRQVTISHPLIYLSTNQAMYDDAIADAYIDAVNTDTFMGRPPQTVKIETISAQAMYERGMWFWRVEYEFRVRFGGWRPRILNTALLPVQRQSILPNGDPGTSEAITVEEVPIDAAGDRIPAGGTPVYVPWDVIDYREMPFSGLGIGYTS